MSQGLYRKAALDRLRSPEQLHTLMRVTGAKAWLALLGCAVIVATAIVGSIVGRVHTRVGGSGIVVGRGGIVELTAPRDGELVSIAAEAGSVVQPGQLVAMLGDGGRVVSSVEGRVIEVRAAVGDRIASGQPLVAIERTAQGAELEALLYFDARVGKALRPGMPVDVLPSTAREGRSGGVIGRVRAVEPYPATRLGMMSALHNAELVDTLLHASGGSPIAVHAEILGADGALTSGTPCTATVITGTRRPIALVFPALDEGE